MKQMIKIGDLISVLYKQIQNVDSVVDIMACLKFVTSIRLNLQIYKLYERECALLIMFMYLDF